MWPCSSHGISTGEHCSRIFPRRSFALLEWSCAVAPLSNVVKGDTGEWNKPKFLFAFWGSLLHFTFSRQCCCIGTIPPYILSFNQSGLLQLRQVFLVFTFLFPFLKCSLYLKSILLSLMPIEIPSLLQISVEILILLGSQPSTAPTGGNSALLFVSCCIMLSPGSEHYWNLTWSRGAPALGHFPRKDPA